MWGHLAGRREKDTITCKLPGFLRDRRDREISHPGILARVIRKRFLLSRMSWPVVADALLRLLALVGLFKLWGNLRDMKLAIFMLV